MKTGGRNRGQSAGIAKSISPEMKQAEQESVAKWGADRLPMEESKLRLSNALQLFYGIQQGRVFSWAEDQKKRLALCAKVSKKVEELMMKALWEADADFFADLSQLIPLAHSGKGASPVEYALLLIWAARDPERHDKALAELEEALSEGELLDLLYDQLCQLHVMAQYDFPEWPATVPELHRHLEKVGVRCDVRTIRDSIQKMKAVAEIEFPVRAGKGKKK